MYSHCWNFFLLVKKMKNFTFDHDGFVLSCVHVYIILNDLVIFFSNYKLSFLILVHEPIIQVG